MPTTSVLFGAVVHHDYHQFYLCDAGFPDLPDDYTEGSVACRVMAAPEALIIHVEREMPVPVRVLLHAERPAVGLHDVDHASETAVSAPSGALVLASLLDDQNKAARLPVPAARLGALVLFEALGSLSFDGLEGEDRYTVHLWPEPGAGEGVRVLKRWPVPS